VRPGREQAVAVAALALGAAVVVLGLLDLPGAALAALTPLVLGALLLQLLARRSQRSTATALRSLAQEHRETDRRLDGVTGPVTEQVEAVRTSLERRLDTTAERLVSSAAHERVAAADRHLETEARLRSLAAALGMPGDSGAADRLRTEVALVHAVSTTRPRLVLQCGGGESTVALALAVQATGAGRVVTLEHDQTRAAQVRARLQQEGLADVAEVRVSPLRAVSAGDASHRWYDPTVLDDLHDIGLLHLDLPPQDGNGDEGGNGDEDGGPDHGPAVPLLLQRCADGATLVVEVPGTDGLDVGRRWPAEHPTLAQHSRDDEWPVVLVHAARDDH
jgi:hypothetical protein